jgi:hypothetical protein
VAYVGALIKFRKDLEAEYDKDLRSKRIDVYKALWNPLQILARYDRPKPLTPRTLEELSVAMRKWYFEVGGLYLSEDTRKCYFNLKQRLQDVRDRATSAPDEEVNPSDQQVLLQAASLLRAQLTFDVGTRKTSPLADS